MPSSTRSASSAGSGSPWVGRGTARGREGFLAVLGPSPVPALLLDADAGPLWVLVANQAARRFLVSSPDPLVGDGLTGVLAPDDLLAVTRAAAEVLGGRVPAWQHEAVLGGTPVGLALSRLVTPGEPALLVVQLLHRTARDPVEHPLGVDAGESPSTDLLERIRRNGERILRLVEGSAIPAHAR